MASEYLSLHHVIKLFRIVNFCYQLKTKPPSEDELIGRCKDAEISSRCISYRLDELYGMAIIVNIHGDRSFTIFHRNGYENYPLNKNQIKEFISDYCTMDETQFTLSHGRFKILNDARGYSLSDIIDVIFRTYSDLL